MTVGSDEAAFARVVSALGPYLDEVVVVGGWAHRLYLHHPLARDPGFRLLRTTDADVAAPARLPVHSVELRKRLLDAGLEEELRGEDRPPISHYHLGNEGGLYVEFLTPLQGNGRRRDGGSRDTTLVGGVSAQRLRHVDLLLMMPASIELAAALGYPLDPPRKVRIAAPSTWMAQKLLVLPTRVRRDQEKDVLYLHDTVLLFASSLDALRGEWDALAVDERRRREIAALATTRFTTVDDRIRGAARIAASAGRTVDPEDIAARCDAALGRIFRGS